jgi:hypothetical protein
MGAIRWALSGPGQCCDVVDKYGHIFPKAFKIFVGHRDPLGLVQKGVNGIVGQHALGIA